MTVTENMATYATVSLIRDTKHLNITLRQIDNPAEVYDEDYEVWVVDDNSHFAHDNEVVRTDSLHYAPYHSWTTVYKDGSVTIEPKPELPSLPGLMMTLMGLVTLNARPTIT